MDLDGGCNDDNDSRCKQSYDSPAFRGGYMDAPEYGAGEEDESCVGDDVECCDGLEECVLDSHSRQKRCFVRHT